MGIVFPIYYFFELLQEREELLIKERQNDPLSKELKEKRREAVEDWKNKVKRKKYDFGP